MAKKKAVVAGTKPETRSLTRSGAGMKTPNIPKAMGKSEGLSIQSAEARGTKGAPKIAEKRIKINGEGGTKMSEKSMGAKPSDVVRTVRVEHHHFHHTDKKEPRT